MKVLVSLTVAGLLTAVSAQVAAASPTVLPGEMDPRGPITTLPFPPQPQPYPVPIPTPRPFPWPGPVCLSCPPFPVDQGPGQVILPAVQQPALR
ncbi:hypothetical protein P1J78_06305 [Psychromarinibacter sp. C21-152]|uniref:Uncharacterized protein n=1 Tax=Psychromarinibacter sediminicola TaxID=3033385 RepID=A0AAE3T7H9_9RHOB|nr:hypothetical protein [Psychromarinibacter sediminicola]MDF0600335.1 hypothetical protein [Psychromarinibacter sediminicola]